MKIDISDMMTAIAKELAYSDDTTQAEFINQFAKELQIVCSSKTETQLCYLSDKLDRDGNWLIEELHGFVALRATQKANP